MAYLADRWWDADLFTIHGNIGLLNKTETEVELVDVLKVLGDVFEAIEDAVFADWRPAVAGGGLKGLVVAVLGKEGLAPHYLVHQG